MGTEARGEPEAAAAAIAASELAGPTDPYDGEDVRRRAAGGAALLTARGILILFMGLAGNIVLARLLSPRDFGLVAIGTVLVLIGRLFAEGGIAAAFIRRPEAPQRRDLQAVLGAQLLLACTIVVVVFAVGAQFGRTGLIPAVVALSLPLTTLRLPATMMCERAMSYRPLATVDIVEALAYYLWSIAAASLGFGAWSMASGFVARAAAGTIAMALLSPLGLIPPVWEWARVRPVLRFGMRFQAVGVGFMVRDQGINVGLASIGGVAVLGVWSFTFRILQIPALLFSSLWRVSFPAMSKILRAGEDPRPLIERGVGVIGVITAAILVGMAGAGPALVPALAGPRWHDVPAVLLCGSLAVMIAAPLTVAVVGYLYASDQPGVVLRAVVAQTVVWFAVTFSLVGSLGVVAAGIGWIAAAIVENQVLARETHRRTGARPLARLALPLGAALPATGAGWAIATTLPHTLPVAILAGLTSEAVLGAVLILFGRALLRDTYGLIRTGARASLAH